ncbi:hypothetical protein VP01_27g14 [Puccinia sorghi]|uniref:Uncharacterized protein n=1 Tax=Puccinia sorghi TaxID=27349 RepID=A0A0L6V2J4_9BASI|nr:hypothetical protein VP01_27g14 [Puccinia sorghi]
MVVTILIQIALSCGVVLLYTVVGNFLLNCLGFRRSGDQVEHGGEEGEGDLEDKEVLEEEEEEEKEEKEDGQCEGLPGPSPDALHLLRLTNAFCPAKTEPSIFGRDVNREEYYTEDEDDFGQDAFSDVLEESTFCLRGVAEIATGDHKSTSSARRSSTTFAPEAHHHQENGTGSHEGGNRKKGGGVFYTNSGCGSEPNGSHWGQLADKKKLFTVRPSITALRRFNHPKQVHQVDQPKFPSNPSRIDYLNSVRSRFKLITSKKLSLMKPINKTIEPAGRVDIHRSSDLDGRRMSSVLFGTA